ncbi:MAG TPA: hypothetical protein VEC99_12590 [Clostridia bacterium]|nr:hypothetical protein [Clostridia bacterium]
MPTVYRIQCSVCGYSPQVNSGLVGYVTTDGRKAGKILAEGYLALKLDSGEFVCLAHPSEQRILQQHGFTWAGAACRGRLFSVMFKLCKECGALYEERQLSSMQAGCSVGAIIALGAVLGMKLILSISWPLSLLGGYFAGLAVFGFVEVLNRWRWRKPNAELRLRECAHCKGTQFVSLLKATRNPLPCPSCGNKGLQVQAAGIS